MTLKPPVRHIPPPLKPPVSISFPQPEVHTLSNGIKVYMLDAGSQEVTSIEMIFRAGSWYQPKPFVAMATNLMLREGTRGYTSAQISELFDFYGAHLETTAERDSAYVSLFSLNKYLAEVIPLLAETVWFPVFPQTEFSVLAGKHKQMLEVNRQKVNFLARVGFNPLIFGESHPYGVSLQPSDIEKAETKDLQQFHSQFYMASNCTILVSGKISGDLMPLLEKYIAAASSDGQPVAGKGFKISSHQERDHFQLKEGAVQSAIRMGSIMVTRNHPDYPGLKVLNTILGGYFGSRLMSNLREDKGFTYGIGSAVVPLHNAGYFVLSAETGADVTIQALKEIKNELLRLCNERVSDDELSLVKNYILGDMLRSVDGPFSQANLYRELIEDKLDSGHLMLMMDTVKNITATELLDLAILYLDPGKLHTLVVGPENCFK